MDTRSKTGRDRSRGEAGQIIVIAALAMMALIAGVSLILEGGNAYAHQRVVQNAADSVANAGATVLAQRLGGGTQADGDVLAAMDSIATANHLDTYKAYYTDVKGKLLNTAGAIAANEAAAAQVGPADGSTIPPGAQGVKVGGSQIFGTTFARAIGITQFKASADAIAITGALTGGKVLPVVFPVSVNECDGTGSTTYTDAPWRLSNPPLIGTDPYKHPTGQEWIIPLCKTGSGSFMILDLKADQDCQQEAESASAVQFAAFPVDVSTDTGNDCTKKIEDAVAKLQGQVVYIPICDGAADLAYSCVTDLGSGGKYHIVRMVGFFIDFLSYSNDKNSSPCVLTTSPTYGTPMANAVGGNGSSSCLAGWFVRYITSGPVGSGAINNGEAIGVQLIR